MERIRIGIVGVGKIALDQHVPAILNNPDFALLATAGGSKALEGVPSFGSVGEMLDDCPELDAVAVCAPTQAHFASAWPALDRGKHVLMEKPPCVTSVEFKELDELAHKRGCTLFQTWHAREASGVEPAARWLQGRTVLSGRVIWRENVREWHPGQKWIWQPDGFGVLDAGINAISVLTAIIPAAIGIASAELFVPENRQAPIGAHVVLHAGAGGIIEAEFDFRHQGPQECVIDLTTDSGRLRLSGHGSQLAIDGVPVDLPASEEYRVLYRRFADLIARGGSEADTRPLELIADVIRLGRRQTVEPFDD